ncbi:MAG TPA: serine hydrolase [Rhodanobacteraceae bacterium]|nr:serine hydrolase [Rhodanobacteraceae bacterium]
MAAVSQCGGIDVVTGVNMRMRSWWLLLALLFAPLALAAPPAAAPTTLQGLDPYVQQVMHDWRVPGLAIAVVKDGKVVLARGYGVRELGKPGKVDADTLFDIGSNTKAFTVAALGTLVSSEKLTWDTQVVDELPHFRLSSPYVTQKLTLRDLLTHRTGYCDPGAAWYSSDDANLIHRVRHQKPEHGFRTRFCYNNVQYLAASHFIPAITGKGWNDYVATRLFQPLGMTRTVSTEAGVAAATDVAAPHGIEDGRPVVIHRYWPHNMDIFAAVGGIWSSANDMSHWLQMLLADGRHDGDTVLSPDVIRAMETPQIVIQPGGIGDEIRHWMPGAHFYTYGLGLFVQDYHGHELVWHAGDIDGMASALVLVPDTHLGIMVLSNMNQANARFAIIARVLQTMLDLPQHDLEPALLADARKGHAKREAMENKLAGTRVPGSKALLRLADYAGNYRGDLDGRARVELDNGHLVLRLGNPDFTGDLTPWHGNTFRVTWRYKFYGTDYATFDVDALGKPVKLSLAGLSTHYARAKPQANASPKATK